MSPGGMEALLGHELGEAAGACRHDREAGGHRLERREREDLRVARGDERDRGVAAQLRELGRVDTAGEAHVRPGGQRLQLGRIGTVTGDDQRQPGVAAGDDRVGDALLVAEPPGVEDVAAGGGARGLGELPLDGPQHARAIVDRRAEGP